MFFTQEDFRKIEQWLLRCSTKDSELPFAGPLDGSEGVAIVQGDRNKRVPLYLFIDEIKNRKYKPDIFSGKGRIILRRNLIGTEDCSLDDEDHYENIIDSSTFTEPNTVYVIRYDFKLKENIKMPPNCELHFEGGSISGGSIDLNGCKLLNLVGQESDYFKDTSLSNWATGQIEYRDNTIKCWDGAKWVSYNTSGSSDTISKAEIISIIDEYLASLILWEQL